MIIRVLVCSRMLLYATGVQRLLEEVPGISVTGLVCNALDLEQHAAGTHDLIVVDTACFSWVAGRAERILLLWDHVGPPHLPLFGDLKTMVSQGLAGVLDSRTDPSLLGKAVFKVHAGELWINHQMIRYSLCGAGAPSVQLSRREAEILRQIYKGHSNKKIADKLSISEQTVKTHCNHLYKKFGVSSRLQLAMRAFTFFK